MRRFEQNRKSNQNKHFTFNNFLSENRAVYEMGGGVVQLYKPLTT